MEYLLHAYFTRNSSLYRYHTQLMHVYPGEKILIFLIYVLKNARNLPEKVPFSAFLGIKTEIKLCIFVPHPYLQNSKRALDISMYILYIKNKMP